MKKTELYRSIDGIRQDESLKEQILKAAEEKDVVTVVKHPVFVPVFIVLLLCLNVGMVAKLVIFNKSQVNMSEFKAKTSVSSSADETSSAFEDAKKAFLDELENNTYDVFNEWHFPDGYVASQTTPSYIYSNDEMITHPAGELTFYRYVQKIQYTNSNDEPDSPIEAFTNHEYIIGCRGSADPENIVSITESNVKNGDLNNDEMRIIKEMHELSLSDEITDKINAIGQKRIDVINIQNPGHKVYMTSAAANNIVYLFPKNGSNDEPDFVFTCGVQGERKEYLVDSTFYNCDIIIDADGNDVTDIHKKSDYSSYWKETVFADPELQEQSTVQIPDIRGLNSADAKKALEDSGLKFSGKISYETPVYFNYENYKFGSVMDTSGFSIGQTVYSGSEVGLVICANEVPYFYGCEVEKAVDMLEKLGLKVKIDYKDGCDPDRDDLYVVECDPSFGSVIKEGDTVTVYLGSTDTYTMSDLIGKAVSLTDKKIYSRKDTAKLLSDRQESDITSITLNDFGYYYPDTVFYGVKYGDLFLIHGFRTSSRDISPLPAFACEMTEQSLAEFDDTEYYKSCNAVYQQLDDGVCVRMPDGYIMYPGYTLKYHTDNNLTINAYFNFENDTLENIIVFADKYNNIIFE